MSKGLGRGLSALINENAARKGPETSLASRVNNLPTHQLEAGPYQTREDFNPEELDALAQSIKENGIVQPVLVRKTRQDRYEIIAGERRWRASQKAGLEVIPTVVLEVDNRKALQISLIENIQRQNLNPLEEAEGYKRLIDEFHYSQEELASVLGKNRSTIANAMRLLTLPEKVKEYMKEGKLTAGHARALVTSEDPQAIAEAIIRNHLNVRQAEALVKSGQAPAKKSTSAPKQSAFTEWEENLTKHIGLPVSISGKGKKGKISLNYRSEEELKSILNKLQSAAF